MLVGVISDTHGAVPAGVFDAFKDVAHIIHAGDIDSPRVLAELETIAPVTAVAGNMDFGEVRRTLPDVTAITVDGVRIAVAHKLPHLLKSQAAASADVMVSGHTHVPSVTRTGPVLLVNPGSATRPRDSSLGTVGVIDTSGERPDAHIVTL
ncbi:MAG: metallophosphoesterase family protein [Coriobacteriia bacterium]